MPDRYLDVITVFLGRLNKVNTNMNLENQLTNSDELMKNLIKIYLIYPRIWDEE